MKETEEHGAKESLLSQTLNYSKRSGKNVIEINEEYDYAADVIRIERTMREVITTIGTLFSIKTDRYKTRRYHGSTPLGERFLGLFRVDIVGIKRHFPHHDLNPYIDLFVRNAEGHSLKLSGWLSNNELKELVDRQNDCIERIRKEAGEPAFKAALGNFTRSSNKNSKELRDYIEALFAKHSRLLVLRIDLGYAKSLCGVTEGFSEMTFPEVMRHKKRLINHIRLKLPKNWLVGYAWKLEYGLKKSFHIHLLVFLDGSMAREDSTIVQKIGEEWNKGITNSNGVYWNCNGAKGSYRTCGIGMVHHSDAVAREGLDKAATYMTKADYYIKMVAPGNARTFGKGVMPTPPNGRGRPRSKGITLHGGMSV